jgi:hypothetical protein
VGHGRAQEIQVTAVRFNERFEDALALGLMLRRFWWYVFSAFPSGQIGRVYLFCHCCFVLFLDAPLNVAQV